MLERLFNKMVGMDRDEAERRLKEIENPELEKVSKTFVEAARVWTDAVRENGIDNLPDSGGVLPNSIPGLKQRVLQGVFEKFGDRLASYTVEKASLKREGGIPLGNDFYWARQMLVTPDWIDGHGKDLDSKSISVLLNTIQEDIFTYEKYIKDIEGGVQKGSGSLSDDQYLRWLNKQHFRAREQLASMLPYLDDEVRLLNEDILRKTDMHTPDFSEGI